MNHIFDLPPLPEGERRTNGSVTVIRYSAAHMQEYAHAAIALVLRDMQQALDLTNRVNARASAAAKVRGVSRATS